MPIEKALLLKGLGVCALCAGGTVVALKWGNINSSFSSSISRKKIVWGGLECEEPTGQEGGGCSLKTGEKIFVKKKGSSSHFELSNLEGGKIKVYKSEEKGDNAYSENFKFLVEEGDIGTTSNKLEEFETYEVKKGTETDGTNLKDQYFLSQKTDVKEEIKKALGLPWDLTDDSQEQANINTESLKKIKFSDGDASISNGTVTLTIAKDTSKTDYPLGYKFTFKNTNSTDSTLTIGKEVITLKKDSPVDFKIKKEGSSLSLEKAWTLEELTKKVGLVKQDDGYWFVGNSGMNVKLGTTKKTSLLKYENPEGRIKVYEGQAGYNEGFKFTVEKGDLKLKEETQSGTVKHPLGQFQSFEIVKEENTWYFSRKEGDEAKIKELLGLPKDNCEFPTETATPKNCTLTGDNIKTIKFDGLGSGSTATLTGTPKLTIHMDSERSDFPLGYKFVFSSDNSSATITIPSSTPSTIVKQDLSYEYKIKRSGDNNQTLSLEKAWTPEILMRGAVGFDDRNNNAWTVGSATIRVKQDSHTSTSVTASGSDGAKIRVYEGTPGYNQGMKFVIEDGDTNLTGGNSINKLTKYETYEISKHENEWYFNRKQKVEDSIKELLGLPKTCEMPTDAGTPKDCTLNGDDDSKLKAIKFEGKGSQELTITGSGSVTVKISKESSEADFPKGYKFTFNSENKEFTIPQGSSSLNIKKKTNTEFKIKESGNSLTLEKSLDITKLAGKLGLTQCGTGGEKKCSFGSTISVWDGDNNYVEGATVSGHESKKISYELDQEDYNQGIKFFVEGEDIDLTAGNGSSPTKPSKICKKNGESSPTYEIAQKTVSGNTAKWYLVKKAK